MALTKIKADGLTADLIDETKLADNSIDSEHYNDGSIDNAHLANNAVGTEEIADDAVTADKLANAINTSIAGKAVLTGSTDNTVCTVTGANAIQGESTLTYNAGALGITGDSSGDGISITNNGDHYTSLNFDADRSAANNAIAIIEGKWNNTTVSSIRLETGDDTTNKDDGEIAFSTTPSGGSITERVRIDSSGNVGINESNANMVNGKLTVKIDTDKHIGFNGSQGEVGNVPALVAYQDNASLQSLGFRGVDIRFADASAERLRIESGGDVKVVDGDLVIGTAGHGIDFSANSHASGMQSELLDSYEEGTWDPDFFYHSSVSGVTGHYTKIGRMVYAYFCGTYYSQSSSQQYISNLPFTIFNVSGSAGGVARGYQNYDIQNGPIYWLEQNTTKMHFYKDNGVNFTAADGNGHNFRGMIVYTAA